jgi:hypothetical protein
MATREPTATQPREVAQWLPACPFLLERGLRTPTLFVILSLAEDLNTDPVALFRGGMARLRG